MPKQYLPPGPSAAPGPGGDEGATRPPGERWPADPWNDDPYWITSDDAKPAAAQPDPEPDG